MRELRLREDSYGMHDFVRHLEKINEKICGEKNPARKELEKNVKPAVNLSWRRGEASMQHDAGGFVHPSRSSGVKPALTQHAEVRRDHPPNVGASGGTRKRPVRRRRWQQYGGDGAVKRKI